MKLAVPAVLGTFGHNTFSPHMPRKSISEPVFDKKRNRWRVTVPASLSSDGKRTRSWHKSRNAARSFIDTIEGKGSEPAAVIAPALALKADEARLILEPWDLDLVIAARILSEALGILDGSGSVIEAAKAFRSSHEARNSSKPLGEAVALYLDSRADLRPTTLKSYRYTLEDVIGGLHTRSMAEIRMEDLEATLSGKGAAAYAMHRRNLGAFWRWAAKVPRQWADLTAVEGLEPPRSSNDEDIQILKPDDVHALLTAAEAEGPAEAAAYAIAVFGGIRMAELGKLTWRDIAADHIEIGRHVAKKHSRRLVPICPTLRAWLTEYRDDAEPSSLVVPPNWVDRSKNVRRRAGWAVAARLLPADILKRNPTRGQWPTNSCRHTCASVQVAIGTPLDELIFKFGHSGGHDLLRKHYVSRLTREDALDILSIGPRGSRLKLKENRKKQTRP